ncbi:MAG: phage holin family protein [Burkholderiales bacterium]|nr:phage holin family protein [Burkholderiales bacterium]
MLPGGGVSGPVRRLGASLLALLRIRLELLAIEVQEEKDRIASLLVWAVLTALMAGFGAVFVALFITVALWDTHRLAALGIAALVFVGLALLALLRVRRLVGLRSTMFQASMAELRQDGRALHPGQAP